MPMLRQPGVISSLHAGMPSKLKLLVGFYCLILIKGPRAHTNPPVTNLRVTMLTVLRAKLSFNQVFWTLTTEATWLGGWREPDLKRHVDPRSVFYGTRNWTLDQHAVDRSCMYAEDPSTLLHALDIQP